MSADRGAWLHYHRQAKAAGESPLVDPIESVEGCTANASAACDAFLPCLTCVLEVSPCLLQQKIVLFKAYTAFKAD